MKINNNITQNAQNKLQVEQIDQQSNIDETDC